MAKIAKHQKEDRNSSTPDSLDRIVTSWSALNTDRLTLTNKTRDTILSESLSGVEIRHQGRLFPVFPRFAIAAILPLILLAVLVAAMLPSDSVMKVLPGAGSVTGDTAIASINVEKDGDQIIFTIANGGTTHYISKSTDPGQFDPGRSVRIQDGTYRDGMLERGNLVFYKID